jgi:sterol desaturase/sphingolipid hydroxylase (fatty acid hydroxylase superfamily)
MTTIQNPMASTWRNTDPKTWKWKHRVLEKLDTWHNDNNDFPVHAKTDKIQWFSQLSIHRWILTHAAWPVVLHAAWNIVLAPWLGRFPHILVFLLYGFANLLNLELEVKCLNRVARECGFLDGDKHSRDKVPDVGIMKVIASIGSIVFVRSALACSLTYNKNAPMALSWWFPVELFLYPIILDFFFYVYHRGTHEIDGLWKYHRTHHLTKHPNPLLSSYADVEQEVIEMAIVPFLTFVTLKAFGFPMGFYDWWLCNSYTLFAEAFGHSGIRAMMTAPGLAGFFLKAVGCELLLEDHDLHHRQGWRKSGNYGKATRFWDKIFGTCLGRVEAKWDNVDYENKLKMSWI